MVTLAPFTANSNSDVHDDIREKVQHFGKYTLFLRVRWEGQYKSHICTLNIELEPAGN